MVRNWLNRLMAPVTEGFAELGTTLKPLADGVDLLLTGPLYQEIAANVAEHYREYISKVK